LDIISYLANQPGDYRRAIAMVRQDLRSIWLAAFQSHLWNQVLAALLRQTCEPAQLSAQQIGLRNVPFFTPLDDNKRQPLLTATLPLPSARLHLPEGPQKELYDQVMAAEGLELRQVRVKYPRDSFFSKGDRPAVVLPGDLKHTVLDDELYAGSHKLTLTFTLPRGSYATILVKRVTGRADDDSDDTADS
jgi:tRNA pseudouridine13 synthase